MDTTSKMKEQSVGSLVAESFERSQVFMRHGIDFCCHGGTTLQAACDEKGLNADDIVAELLTETSEQTVDFGAWPLDLVADYVLKKHHRNYHEQRDNILALVKKVASVHGEHHPELIQVAQQVEASFEELDAHFAKEEQVLFPYLYELFEAHSEHRHAPAFHCGSILPPIRQMMNEHEGAGETWMAIEQLTNGFTTPADGCNSYRAMNMTLNRFQKDLFEHIHLENNILFPGFLKMEEENMNL